MDNEALLKATDLLKTMPRYGAIKGMTRLGGLTNEVYRVVTDREILCFRVPGKGTEDYINRRHEAQAARETARVGVSPDVLHFDERTGMCLTRFLEGTVSMSRDLFGEREGAPGRAGVALRHLHTSDAVFANRFELFSMINDYIKLLDAKNASVPDGYRDAMKASEAAGSALSAHPLPLVPCHCDPMTENFLDTGDRMWIVDWEYSGMNDPLWDLGDLSVEAAMTSRQEDQMVLAYFGCEPTRAQRGRILIYKAMCDLLWTLWGLIQHSNNNPSDDFWAYALNRFSRCQTLMSSQDFTRAVEDVAAG